MDTLDKYQGTQLTMGVFVHVPPEINVNPQKKEENLPSQQLVVPCRAVTIVKVGLDPIHILGREKKYWIYLLEALDKSVSESR